MRTANMEAPDDRGKNRPRNVRVGRPLGVRNNDQSVRGTRANSSRGKGTKKGGNS